MEKKVAIGIQEFDKLREDNFFYIDKTSFIKEEGTEKVDYTTYI